MKYQIEMVCIKTLKKNPKNLNEHPESQIKRLAKIIDYQGFRNPLIVSNQSGKIVAGHARLEAAKLLKLKFVPVCFQDFESSGQEYSHMVADNALSAWSDFNFTKFKTEAENWNIDADFFGLENFNFNLEELKELPKTEQSEKTNSFKLEVCFSNETDLQRIKTKLLKEGFLVTVKS